MNINDLNLPKDWIELIKDAMASNLTKEEFREFLKAEKEKRENN